MIGLLPSVILKAKADDIKEHIKNIQKKIETLKGRSGSSEYTEVPGMSDMVFDRDGNMVPKHEMEMDTESEILRLTSKLKELESQLEKWTESSRYQTHQAKKKKVAQQTKESMERQGRVKIQRREENEARERQEEAQRQEEQELQSKIDNFRAEGFNPKVARAMVLERQEREERRITNQAARKERERKREEGKLQQEQDPHGLIAEWERQREEAERDPEEDWKQYSRGGFGESDYDPFTDETEEGAAAPDMNFFEQMKRNVQERQEEEEGREGES